MRVFHLIFLLFPWFADISAQTLHLDATIHSIGYQIALPLGFDSDTTAVTSVRYKTSNGNWQEGFPAARVRTDAGAYEFRGSLFRLNADTEYELEINVVDSFPALQSFVLHGSIRTRKNPQIEMGGLLRYVSPAGSGTAYTEANPGNLKTLLTAGLSCGTTVLLKGGAYSLGDMQLNLTSDCDAAHPIVLMAAPGETPVFDGGSHQQYDWTEVGAGSGIYYAAIDPTLGFNSLCLLDDSLRLYPYPFLNPQSLPVANLAQLSYDESGFYRVDNQVYIKTLDQRDPNHSDVTFSKFFTGLRVNGNGKQNYLYLKGITFKYYAKGSCLKNFLGLIDVCYPSVTLTFENANHVVVDHCRFDYCNSPISFDDACNDNVVQYCSFKDGTGKWSHGAFKQTRNELVFEQGTYGRYLEYAAIGINPGSTSAARNIVRYDTVYGTVGGLVGERITADGILAETDIYGNRVAWCYNGINADAGSTNTRMWDNEIGYCLANLSFIAGRLGPNYVFNNVMHHIQERKNHYDIFFLDCDNVTSTKIWGTGVKLNADPVSANPPDMYFFNNTFHSVDTLGFDMYLWTPTWKNLVSRNNIYHSAGKSCFFFDDIKGHTNYSFQSQHDNFFHTGNQIAIVQPVNGMPACNVYESPEALGAGLQTISGSTGVWVTEGLAQDAGFEDPSSGDFRLKSGSPMVDKGVVIPGITRQFYGCAPDIGAFERVDSCVVIAAETPVATLARIFPSITTDLPVRIAAVEEVELVLFDLMGRKLYQNRLKAGEELEIPAGVFGMGLNVLEVRACETGKRVSYKIMRLGRVGG